MQGLWNGNYLKQFFLLHTFCIGLTSPGAAVGPLCEVRLGLPRAGPSWSQLVPMAPPQGAAGPYSYFGVTSGV